MHPGVSQSGHKLAGKKEREMGRVRKREREREREREKGREGEGRERVTWIEMQTWF